MSLNLYFIPLDKVIIEIFFFLAHCALRIIKKKKKKISLTRLRKKNQNNQLQIKFISSNIIL